MKWSAVAAAMLIAAAPLTARQPPTPAAQTQAAASQPQVGPGAKITLRGCVRPGVDKDTVLMTDVVEADAGRSAMPAEAHGRKVLFWLDRDDRLKEHVGRMVEVSGVQGGLEKSEIEFKAGRQKEGGFVAEFEGPGRDVKASSDVVGQALGTTGRAEDKKDLQTFLVKVKVDSVRPVAGTCR